MAIGRRTFLQCAGAAVVSPACSGVAPAQAYPGRPVTMIVPFAAGGPADAVGRIIVERMRLALGQPVLIENIAGADGSIGVGRASRAKPDGYTVSFGITGSHVLNGAFYALPYDLLNDFAPVSALATTANLLFARKTLAAGGLSDLITWLKANPQATMGVGAANLRLLALMFQKETATRFAVVPYRGLAPIMQDLVAGQIDLAVGTPNELQLMRAGSVRAYAATSDKRLAVAPDIPTFAELGLPLLSFNSWYGLFVPKGTPKDIIGRLNAAVADALADPVTQSRLSTLGFEVHPRERQTPEALGWLQRSDAEKWWPIIKELGIKAE